MWVLLFPISKFLRLWEQILPATLLIPTLCACGHNAFYACGHNATEVWKGYATEVPESGTRYRELPLYGVCATCVYALIIYAMCRRGNGQVICRESKILTSEIGLEVMVVGPCLIFKLMRRYLFRHIGCH